MTVAAFVIAVLGFALGVSSLTWQVYTFLMQGARPKLTPVIGMLAADGTGILTNDATRDIRPSLASAIQQIEPGPPIVGVKVVNAGRASFHVAGWAIQAEPSGTSFHVVGERIGSPDIPCDIPAGAEQIFYMHFDAASTLKTTADKIEGAAQKIVATVSSGGHLFKSKPIASVNLTIGQ